VTGWAPEREERKRKIIKKEKQIYALGFIVFLYIHLLLGLPNRVARSSLLRFCVLFFYSPPNLRVQSIVTFLISLP
jgi:hypothetical protein